MAFVDEKFEERVQFGGPNDCWEWLGPKTASGHGLYHCTLLDSRVIVHRRVFEWHHRREIGPGLQIRHRCDNPSCVNPAHLLEGTHKDNMRDMKVRGRAASKANGRHGAITHPERVLRGEDNGNSKLTWEKVAEIRRLRLRGWTLVKLADRFNVSNPLISQICLGRIWVPKE